MHKDAPNQGLGSPKEPPHRETTNSLGENGNPSLPLTVSCEKSGPTIMPEPLGEALVAAGPNRMYGIVFELCSEALIQNYPNSSWNKAHGEIKQILEKYGLVWQQGNLYFGKPNVDGITCTLAVVDCAHSLPWFKKSVQSISLLRIEEKSDLLPALQS